jgi:DNA polymerase III epsilon subunit-like protein
MLIMIFDTETTGLPKTKFINPGNLDLWPHIVQLSYVLLDAEEKRIEKVQDNIISVRSGILIPEESSKIHGITQTMSLEQGIPIEYALEQFIDDFNKVSEIVGHNIEFDVNIVLVEAMRVLQQLNAEALPYKKPGQADKIRVFLDDFKKAKQFCTMKNSIDLCAIKKTSRDGKEYNKFPRLEELHKHLFGTVPSHLHNSLVDVFVCMHCYWKIRYGEDKDFYMD